MFNTREKKERALGTKLFLKAHRCNSAKCATVRRPHRPGLHGQARHSSSEVGQQLNEKQKIKFSYGIRESQMLKVFQEASKKSDVTGLVMIQLLESRLDNVLFRLGFAPSRSVGRQLAGHGHVTVNGRKVSVPSYIVKVGDKIGIRKESNDAGPLKDLSERLKKYEVPTWLKLDKDKLEGEMVALPQEVEVPFDVNMVVDYYSK